jgi:hypothetical protein
MMSRVGKVLRVRVTLTVDVDVAEYREAYGAESVADIRESVRYAASDGRGKGASRMTRRDYVRIAAALRGTTSGADGAPLQSGLTLAEAQAHCNDPETSSSTATSSAARARTRRMGAWLDGYSDA